MPFDPRIPSSVQDYGSVLKALVSHMNMYVISFANVAAIATADGTDPATTQTLANVNKAKINELINAINAYTPAPVAGSVPLVVLADAVDPATTQALANQDKATINLLLAALAAANIAVSVTAIATADGSNAATTMALANANKAKMNTLISTLVAHRKMAP